MKLFTIFINSIFSARVRKHVNTVTIATSVVVQGLAHFQIPDQTHARFLPGVDQDHAQSPSHQRGHGPSPYQNLDHEVRLAVPVLLQNVRFECLGVDLHPDV